MVDEDSRNPLTIITEDGLFRYTKIPEGYASSPAKCQKNFDSTYYFDYFAGNTLYGDLHRYHSLHRPDTGRAYKNFGKNFS